MDTGVVGGVVGHVLVGEVDLGGGYVFKPVDPVVFGHGVHGLDEALVGLMVFIRGRVVGYVAVSVGKAA